MYKLLKSGIQANVQLREYIVDSTSDINDLPDGDPFGSTAFVISTSETYMKNSSGEYVKITIAGKESGGTIEPFSVNGTVAIDAESGKETMSLNKTAYELYSSISEGRMVRIYTHVVRDGVEIDVTLILSCEAQQLDVHGDFFYMFASRICNESGEKVFYCDIVGPDDTVVFTEV